MMPRRRKTPARRTALERRLALAALAVAIIPAGLAAKLYTGPAAGWVANSFAGALYVVFFCLVCGAVFHRARPWTVVAVVTGVTCLLEVAQLWHPVWLTALRATLPGRALLGTTFVPSDFIHYLLGAVLAWPVLSRTRPPRSV